jgi:two-component system chemotaxis response regulator CheY
MGVVPECSTFIAEGQMPRQVLVVDDSVVIRQVVRADLSQRGYAVDEAAGGRSALEKARQVHYDLIVTDQNMPGMDGLALVKTLRELPGYEETPVLVLTTETSTEMKSAFRSAGATGWMSKPYSPERMTPALAKMLPDGP